LTVHDRSKASAAALQPVCGTAAVISCGGGVISVLVDSKISVVYQYRLKLQVISRAAFAM